MPLEKTKETNYFCFGFFVCPPPFFFYLLLLLVVLVNISVTWTHSRLLYNPFPHDTSHFFQEGNFTSNSQLLFESQTIDELTSELTERWEFCSQRNISWIVHCGICEKYLRKHYMFGAI